MFVVDSTCSWTGIRAIDAYRLSAATLTGLGEAAEYSINTAKLFAAFDAVINSRSTQTANIEGSVALIHSFGVLSMDCQSDI